MNAQIMALLQSIIAGSVHLLENLDNLDEDCQGSLAKELAKIEETIWDVVDHVEDKEIYPNYKTILH